MIRTNTLHTGLLAGLISAFMWVLAFPPFSIAEMGYLFAVPLILWLILAQPGWKLCLLVASISGTVAFIGTIIWLRHVTWPGLLCLCILLGLMWGLWLCLAKWLLGSWQLDSLDYCPRKLGSRLWPMVQLSAGWVVLEWVRTWLFSGFPWAPLAASQWQRPAMLQVLDITGAYGLSFVLIFFNCTISLTLLKFIRLIKIRSQPSLSESDEPQPQNASETLRPPAEFYLGLALVMACALLMLPSGYLKTDQSEPLLRVAPVQPAIEQTYGWDTQSAGDTMDTLRFLTRTAALLKPDLILWPESITPWPLEGHAEFLEFMEEEIAEIGIPLLTGNYSELGDFRYYNTVALVTPGEGLHLPTYKKQKLVPFGEFVPLADVLPIGRLVGEGTFIPGKEARLIPFNGKNIASLICYEDVFPWIPRRFFTEGTINENSPAKPDIYFVAANNAWYGKEACHEQHLMHSVLRAVETRRPFMRCGIDGWSGWIDEYGRIRHQLEREGERYHFRGTEVMQVEASKLWQHRESFYIRWGNWFVWLCMVIVITFTSPAAWTRKRNKRVTFH